MSTDARTWEGQTLYDDTGDKVGTIDAVYLDRETDEPEWATVNTGLFGMSSSFVPLGDARPGDDGIVTSHSKDRVKDAPNIDADGQLSEDEESRLYDHYGMDYQPYGGQGTDVGDRDRTDRDRTDRDRTDRDDTDRDDTDRDDTDEFATDRDRSDRTGGTSLTRSEEELRVGTTEREAGRVRLRKYVETDTVTKQVPIKREKVSIEREPIAEGEGEGDTSDIDGEIGEEDVDITLREEEAVVDKRAVAKERVRVDKEVEQDEVEVSEEVRREQFDVEGEGEHADTRLPE